MTDPTDSAAKQAKPRPPKSLSPRARAWWKRVVSAYELRPDELLLLERACKTLDRVDELEKAMATQPLTTTGSMGQMREHPLLSEARQQSALLNRTLAQLKLPDEDTHGATNKNRSAAQSRWGKFGAQDSTSSRWEYGQ